MGICLSKTPRPPSSARLPDLPPDVAELILCRLTSPADRHSFWAVCRDWRLATQRHRALGGTTPWLNLGRGVYQSLDGEVHRFGCHGSSSCWLLYYHDPADNNRTTGGGQSIFLRNPCHASAASIEMMWPCEVTPKILMCPSLSVAVILHRGCGIMAPLASMSRASTRHPWEPLVGKNHADMAFYRGKIFTVTHIGELIYHYLCSRRGCEIAMKSCVARDQAVENTVRHLVVSADKKKLLLVRWSIPRRRANVLEVHDHRHWMDLRVLELDLAKGVWSEVKNLGGQSLFVSKSCSRAFGSVEKSHPRFPQGNCVYILGIDWHQKREIAGVSPCRCLECHDQIDGAMPSYCVYDIMTATVSLVSLGGGHNLESARSEWFFPCE